MFYNNENMVYDKSKYEDMEDYDPNLMVYDDENSEVMIKFIDDSSYKYEKFLYDKNGKRMEVVYDPEDEDYALSNDWRVTSKSISESFTLSTLYKEFEKVPKFNAKILKTKRYDAYRFNTEMIMPSQISNANGDDDRSIGAKGKTDLIYEVETALVNNPTSNIRILQEILGDYRQEMYTLAPRYDSDLGTDYLKTCVDKLNYTLDIYSQSREELK